MFQLPPGTLDTIEKANHYEPNDCLREVILRWLRRSGYSQSRPTWMWLVEVVGSPAGENNPELARRIASQHPKGCITEQLYLYFGVLYNIKGTVLHLQVYMSRFKGYVYCTSLIPRFLHLQFLITGVQKTWK